METTKFNKLKQEVLRRAKENSACQNEYKKAYQSEDMQTLCQVLKDNFVWGCRNNVITADLIESYKEDFAENFIFCNINAKRGCLLVDNSSVVARGNSSVVAWENSSVEARENSSVVARGNSSVVAWENSSVVARGNSSVVAWENSSVVAWENSSVEARGNSSVVARDNSSVVAWGNSSVVARDNSSVVAWENSSVEARDNSSVEARDNSYITSYSVIECKLSGNAIYRVRETNEVRYVSDSIKFVKVGS